MADEYDVVIAGGGITGLSAGLTAARLGRSALVLTGDVLGGHLLSVETVDGYPGFPEGVPGFDLCPMAEEQAMAAGAQFAPGEVTGLEAADGRWQVTASEGTYSAGAVILATGGSMKTLGIPGEEELRGKGVSHCATCDAPLLRGKVACVVGGGDSAAQEGLTLAAHAEKVLILHRGEALSAQAVYRDRVLQTANIEVRFGVMVEAILGDSGVTGVRLAGGEKIAADGVFVYIGLAPNTGFLAGSPVLSETGHIAVDESMRTVQPGLLAAGIVRASAAGRAASSAGDGASAAIAADRFLSGGEWR